MGITFKLPSILRLACFLPLLAGSLSLPALALEPPHWAFQPVQRQEPPQVKNSHWARRELDAFVLARLEIAGLQPAPPADRRTLLRRASLRVPGIARWRGRIPARQVSPQMAITMDWTATFLALAGAEANPRYPMDGVNLLPVLAGEAACFDRTLLWRTPTASAVRRGPWKLYREIDADAARLYNLVRDIREYASFEHEHPAIRDQLAAAYADWESTLLPRPAPSPSPGKPGLDFRIF